MSLAPVIILLLTISPFTISFLQYLVQLTRIMTTCIWTPHKFYHFCPSNGHQKLVIDAICFWLTVSEHKVWYYWNSSDTHQMLLFLGCPLLKQKPSSTFSEFNKARCPKSQDWITPRAISHLCSSLKMFHGSFSSIFPTFIFLCSLLLWESFILLPRWNKTKDSHWLALCEFPTYSIFPRWDLPAVQ